MDHRTAKHTYTEQILIPAAVCDDGIPVSNMEIPVVDGPKVSCHALAQADVSKLPQFSVLTRSRIPAAIFSGTVVGTVVIVSSSQQGIVVAADSRASFDGRSDDAYCKILPLTGSLVFAVAGISRDSAPWLPEHLQFDSGLLASAAVESFQRDPSSTYEAGKGIVEIAIRWGFYMSSRLRRGAPIELKSWLKGQSEHLRHTFVNGIFAGAEPNGELTVAVAQVEYGPPRNGMIVPLASTQIHVIDLPKDFTVIQAYGRSAVFESFRKKSLGDSTDRAGRHIRDSVYGDPSTFDERIPSWFVRQTIKYDDARSFPGGPKLVGGRVDAVRIRRGGDFGWISKKPCCEADRPR